MTVCIFHFYFFRSFSFSENFLALYDARNYAPSAFSSRGKFALNIHEWKPNNGREILFCHVLESVKVTAVNQLTAAPRGVVKKGNPSLCDKLFSQEVSNS